MPRARILLIGSTGEMHASLARALGAESEVMRARDIASSVALLSLGFLEAVVVDLDAGANPALGTFRSIEALAPSTEVVVAARQGSPEDAIQAAQGGLWELLVPPLDGDRVALAVLRALDRHRLREQAGELRGRIRASEGLPKAMPGAPGARLLTLPYRRTVDMARDQASRDYLAALLLEARGNVTRAAARAGLERETLHRLLRRYEVRPGAYRAARTNAAPSHRDPGGHEASQARAGSSYSALSSEASERPMLSSSE